MVESAKGKKVVSLPEKKDAANAALPAIRREAERPNIMPMDKMESVAGKELTEHVTQKKHTVASKIKAAAKKMDQIDSVVSKELTEYVPQKKPTVARKMKAALKKILPRKKRMLYPITGATLRFHKDDDVDPAAEKSIGTA